MQRTVVDSTSFRSLGYDPAHNLLEVEFLNGHIYRYLDVPRDVSMTSSTVLDPKVATSTSTFVTRSRAWKCLSVPPHRSQRQSPSRS